MVTFAKYGNEIAGVNFRKYRANLSPWHGHCIVQGRALTRIIHDVCELDLLLSCMIFGGVCAERWLGAGCGAVFVVVRGGSTSRVFGSSGELE